jgi:hypothetical protein
LPASWRGYVCGLLAGRFKKRLSSPCVARFKVTCFVVVFSNAMEVESRLMLIRNKSSDLNKLQITRLRLDLDLIPKSSSSGHWTSAPFMVNCIHESARIRVICLSIIHTSEDSQFRERNWFSRAYVRGPTLLIRRDRWLWDELDFSFFSDVITFSYQNVLACAICHTSM